MGVAPKYLCDAIQLLTSASSLRPLHSLDRREFFVPRTRTTMAKSRSFSVAGPSLWNRLPPSARASFLSPIFLLPYHFLKLVSFLGANRTKSTSVGPRPLSLNTLPYQTIPFQLCMLVISMNHQVVKKHKLQLETMRQLL